VLKKTDDVRRLEKSKSVSRKNSAAELGRPNNIVVK